MLINIHLVTNVVGIIRPIVENVGNIHLVTKYPETRLVSCNVMMYESALHNDALKINENVIRVMHAYAMT